MFKKILICVALVAGGATANAGPVLLNEGFEAGAALTDWWVANVTNPSGDSWFQGNTGVFDAAAGSADSYLASNYLVAGAAGSISAWLITPSLYADTGVAELTFSTRTAGDFPGDNLEVLVNNTGVLDLNNWLSLGVIGADSFPTDWTSFSFLYSGAAADIRFAFRYFVDDVAVGGDYIGIDSVKVTSVPEPGTLGLLAMGMLLTPLISRRRRARV